MASGEKIKTCARLLFQARTRNFRLYDIPKHIRPETVAEGYQVQKELAGMLARANGWKRLGLKAANTNATSQQFLNLDEPFFGVLLGPKEGRVGVPNNPYKASGVKSMNVAICEPEFAFEVTRSGEVKSVAPAVEIVHSTFVDWKVVGAPSLIADMACNGTWVRGAPVPFSKDISLNSCSLKVNGKRIAEGKADRVMGGPLKVVDALKDMLRFDPGVFYGGHIDDTIWISTGVCVDPPYHTCMPFDNIEVEFDGGVGPIALSCLK